MSYHYYQIEADGFWVNVCNPAWGTNKHKFYKLAGAWARRFYTFTADPAQRLEMLEFLRLQMGWEERLTQGTVLQLCRVHADKAGSLPDAGCCMGTLAYDVQVVSSRVKQLFDRLGLSDELEYERYPVYTLDGKTFIQNYYCVRYLVHLDCVDEQQSYFHLDPPYRVERQLVLRRNADGHSLSAWCFPDNWNGYAVRWFYHSNHIRWEGCGNDYRVRGAEPAG